MGKLRSSPSLRFVGMTIWGGLLIMTVVMMHVWLETKKRPGFDDRERNIVELEGRTAWNAVIKIRPRFDDRERNIVELEGVEPFQFDG